MASPNSRDTLITYCKQRLGDPVIEINVDESQIDDRIDEGIQYYQEFHSDATLRTFLKHQVTQTDIDNGYISVPTDTVFITRVFPLISSFTGGTNFFDIKYQMHLNDIADIQRFAGDLAYYEQMQQYLSLLDMKLNGFPLTTFARHQDRLYIHGSFESKDIAVGEFIVFEVYSLLNPDTHTTIYNDLWLKEYCTALIKMQWGSNLIKFEGVQLPGGVTFNGRQIYDDAVTEIDKLRERIRDEYEMPIDFFLG